MRSSGSPTRRCRLVGTLFACAAFLGATEVTACSGEDCSGTSCPLPVVVELPAESVPPDASPRLCVDNTCTTNVTETMANHFGWEDRWSADDDIQVRLEFVDDSGVIVPAFMGSGTLSGECRKTLQLRLSADGNSLIAA